MEAPSDNLFVTNLPVGCDEDTLSSVFSQFGSLMQVKLLGNPGIPGGSPAALVRYATEAEATMVLNSVNGQTPPGFTEPVSIRYAVNKNAKGGCKGWGGKGDGGKGWGGGDGKGYGKWNAGDASWQANGWGGWGGSSGGGGAGSNSNIYVKGLPKDANEALVTQNFSEFGKVTSVKILSNPLGLGGTAALVQFESPEVAQTVISTLNGQQPPGFTERLTVKFAANNGAFGGRGPTAGGKGGSFNSDTLVQMVYDSGAIPAGKDHRSAEGTLYVKGLPGDTSETHLYTLFAPFGAISSVSAKTGGYPGDQWAIGFVNFNDPNAAQNAIAAYDGMQMPNGGQLSVSIKAQKAQW
eukprot:TRINITY_DN64864_c0_g1_i1.p1 TRINITY_DN64864_c0_g1~~TRINITY_DN64864_c0_g1_i1.p1  ORF type:complete len:352 (-),score=62.22 TRINITY_DN64864_c0_g1_i1:149-1204(-)